MDNVRRNELFPCLYRCILFDIEEKSNNESHYILWNILKIIKYPFLLLLFLHLLVTQILKNYVKIISEINWRLIRKIGRLIFVIIEQNCFICIMFMCQTLCLLGQLSTFVLSSAEVS